MKAYVRLAAVLGVTAFLSLGAYYGLDSGWGQLMPIEIELDQNSDQQHLFTRIKKSLSKPMKAYQGKWLWEISLEEILKEVEKDRRVQAVRIVRQFPNRLLITLMPHRPVLAWVDEVGKLFPVAADASLLPALPFREAGDMPLLRGRFFKDREELREQAIKLVEELPIEGGFSRAMVSEISYSEKNGFTVLLTRGGVSVRLGEGEYSRKARRVEQVLNYLRDQQIKGRVIDARFAKKVVVRLRNEP